MGHRGGRIYSTALAVLTLEVYYRYALERPEPVATLDTRGKRAIIKKWGEPVDERAVGRADRQ